METINLTYLEDWLQGLISRPLMYANHPQFLEGEFYAILKLMDEIVFPKKLEELAKSFSYKYNLFVNKIVFDGKKPSHVACFAAHHYGDVELLAQFLHVFVEAEVYPVLGDQPKKGSK